MSGTVKGAAWRLVLPEIRKIVKEELDSQLRPVHSEITRLDEKMESVRNELKADVARVDAKVDSHHRELSAEMDSVRKELSAQIDGAQRGLSVQIGATRGEVSTLKGQMDLVREVERLKVEVASLKGK